MLPAAVAKRGPHGISTIAIVASSTGVIFLGLLEFEAIVEILNLLCKFEGQCSYRNDTLFRSNTRLKPDIRINNVICRIGSDRIGSPKTKNSFPIRHETPFDRASCDECHGSLFVATAVAECEEMALAVALSFV